MGETENRLCIGGMKNQHNWRARPGVTHLNPISHALNAAVSDFFPVQPETKHLESTSENLAYIGTLLEPSGAVESVRAALGHPS